MKSLINNKLIILYGDFLMYLIFCDCYHIHYAKLMSQNARVSLLILKEFFMKFTRILVCSGWLTEIITNPLVKSFISIDFQFIFFWVYNEWGWKFFFITRYKLNSNAMRIGSNLLNRWIFRFDEIIYDPRGFFPNLTSNCENIR